MRADNGRTDQDNALVLKLLLVVILAAMVMTYFSYHDADPAPPSNRPASEDGLLVP